MKITDIRPTTITVPLEAPLRHSNGAHWGRFVRTVIEVETDEGIVGLGEMGGGGEGAALAFAGLKNYLVGHDPFHLNRLRYAICNPTAALYNKLTRSFTPGASDWLAWTSSARSSAFPSINCSAGGFATRSASRATYSIATRTPTRERAKSAQSISSSITSAP